MTHPPPCHPDCKSVSYEWRHFPRLVEPILLCDWCGGTYLLPQAWRIKPGIRNL